MTQFVAFLRAINVGGHRKIMMVDLRDQFEALGFTNVATLIQSGNIVFDSDEVDGILALEQRIEAQLAQAFGFEVPTFVRPAEDLIDVTNHNPFGEAAEHEQAKLYVTFLRHEPDPERAQQLLAHTSDIDTLSLYGPHVFWLRRPDLGKSAIANALIEKELGLQSTNRNTTTLRKMIDKYLSDGDGV